MKKTLLSLLFVLVANLTTVNAQVAHSVGLAYSPLGSQKVNFAQAEGILNLENFREVSYREVMGVSLFYERRPSASGLSYLFDLRAAGGMLMDTAPTQEIPGISMYDITGVVYMGYQTGFKRLQWLFYPVGLGASYFMGTESDGVRFTYSARTHLLFYAGRRFGILGGVAYKCSFGKPDDPSYGKVQVKYPGFYPYVGISLSL